MNKLAFILIAFMITACAPPVAKQSELSVDPVFQPYVNSFVAKSKEEGRPVTVDNLVIRLDPSMTGPGNGSTGWILGVCTIGSNTPTIRVNPFFWNNKNYSNADREELIFHEMGHCVLGRGHTSNTITTVDGAALAESIMNPYHLGARKYTISYNYYMQELFGAPITARAVTYGPNQFTNIYATAASSMGFGQTEKSYQVTANSEGSIDNFEDENPDTPSIEGLACGEEN